VRSLGVGGYFGRFINLKQGPLGFYIGILETISELAKVISLSFRLFGNIFAGEVLLSVIGFLVPLVITIPFLGLELFVGAIQAFVFSLLTLVFATMAVTGHEEDHATEAGTHH
jgi:F-type H+-transporting ATPase subunit a